MAAASKSSDLMSNITECPICKQELIQPKSLPCIHTFCLTCLEEYGKDDMPGDSITCPVCRRNFIIPAGGFKDLPTNPVISDLQEWKKLSATVNEDVSGPLCGFTCSTLGNNTSTASKYCVNCCKNLCEQCHVRHAAFKGFSEHRVVNVKDKPLPEEQLRMRKANCEEHSNKKIKWFCYDCNKVLCTHCYVGKHNLHKCSDVNESAGEFRPKLKTYAGNADTNATKNTRELDNLISIKAKYTEKMGSLMREIKEESKRQIARIISDEQSLLTEVESCIDEQYKAMESRRLDLER